MKHSKKILFAMLLVFCSAVAFTGCASKSKCDNCGKETTVFEADVNGKKMKLCSECMEKLVSDKVDEFNETEKTDQEDGAENGDGPITLDEIKEASGSDYACVTNDNGFVTFLRGKFYDSAVKDEADAENVLNAVQHLIGGDDDIALRFYGMLGDDNGYSYYTYHQISGDTPVEGAMVKLIVDPDGNAAALSSSIKPEVKGNMDSVIPQEEAVSIVKDALKQGEPDVKYQFYEDKTDKIIVVYNDVSYLCYAIYTDNPTGEERDGRFKVHYVTNAGQYLYSSVLWEIGSDEAVAGGDNSSYFEGTPDTYTGEVAYGNGEKVTITVPVIHSEADGCYYLADQERKIAVGDFSSLYLEHRPEIASSADNSGWGDYTLITYNNFIKIYDLVAETGWKSIDGVGTPIYIGDNSFAGPCLVGKVDGWQMFSLSQADRSYDSLDTAGHEYTHGLQMNTSGVVYRNETGSIAEALADTIGNILQMMVKDTDDEEWLIGEKDHAIRCMTDPNRFGQPEFVGDMFYSPALKLPHASNDNGGNHINGSLLGGVAPRLYQSGMSLEGERNLWITLLCDLVPGSGYKEVQEMLKFAADVSGQSEFKDAIDKAFSEIGLDGTKVDRQKEGCGAFQFTLPGWDNEKYAYVVMIYPMNDESKLYYSWPGDDSNGTFTYKVPTGDYILRAARTERETNETLWMSNTADGWIEESEQTVPASVSVGDNETVEFTIDMP